MQLVCRSRGAGGRYQSMYAVGARAQQRIRIMLSSLGILFFFVLRVYSADTFPVRFVVLL